LIFWQYAVIEFDDVMRRVMETLFVVMKFVQICGE
jgi:hypothetical protein